MGCKNEFCGKAAKEENKAANDKGAAPKENKCCKPKADAPKAKGCGCGC